MKPILGEFPAIVHVPGTAKIVWMCTALGISCLFLAIDVVSVEKRSSSSSLNHNALPSFYICRTVDNDTITSIRSKVSQYIVLCTIVKLAAGKCIKDKKTNNSVKILPLHRIIFLFGGSSASCS